MKDLPKKLKGGLNCGKNLPLMEIAERNGTPVCRFVSEGRAGEPDFEEATVMHKGWSWANVAASVGLFPSSSEARRRGWDIPLPEGLTEAFLSLSDGTPRFIFILK